MGKTNTSWISILKITKSLKVLELAKDSLCHFQRTSSYKQPNINKALQPFLIDLFHESSTSYVSQIADKLH